MLIALTVLSVEWSGIILWFCRTMVRKAVSGLSNINFFSFGISWQEGNPSLVFGYRSSANSSAMLITSPTVNLTTGVWHHVVVIVNPSSPNVQLYVDGVSIFTSDFENGKIETGIGPLTVGDSFSGFLQDVRIYTRPLVDSQIQLLADGVTYLSGANILPHCLCTEKEPSVSPINDRLCQALNSSSRVER